MAVRSMTGFARADVETESGSFVWELRAVNGKTLDVRFRLPQGLDHLEADLRRRMAAVVSRGNVQANLQWRREAGAPALVVNEEMLAQILAMSGKLVADGHAAPPTADGLLAIKGLIDIAEESLDETGAKARDQAIIAGFEAAVARLEVVRRDEGTALANVLGTRLEEIAALTDRADDDPARTSEAIRARLKDQVQTLIQANSDFDEARLHQEAALIAARADIREEIDRLRAHVVAARALLAEGGVIGRRLDFLSQEFHRESNTICSKSNASSLTAIGLDLKIVVDQFREQVQNIE
ncbi:YicC family protein [Jiella sp. MQZ9-1]|uniref:YicC family protein n=1 Tax=Jiella flava TaxID=2816857 RepID=A0A939FWD1_9HYPH|nr:YicC/YloC family endoribonuclease [Jiella flava]MBO0661981.1 YicC family protein [Jiella flava]MCD2470692.1 YicC family protein [Jiella flava]